MRKIKIGIIGCGSISNVHSASLMKLCDEFESEVVAFADIELHKRVFMSERFPTARQYDLGINLLMNEQLDIIHICLPTYLHAEHAILAMEKGMHVFIEKPVCLKRQEARQLLETEKKTGKKIMVGQVVRFFDEYRYLNDIYISELYGKLRSLVLQRLMGGVSLKNLKSRSWFLQPDKSGSVVLDLHIHDVDFMRSILGEPKSVSIVTDMGIGDDQPTHVAAVYTYDNVLAFAEGGWGLANTYGFRMNYRANFENATIVYESWNKPTVTIYNSDGQITYPQIPTLNRYSSVPGMEQIAGVGPYYEEIRYFLECVIEDKPIKQASLTDSIKSFELTMTELEMAYAQAGVKFPIKEI